VHDTLFLAFYGRLENLSKEPPTFVFSHPVSGVDEVEQVRRIFGTLEHKHEFIVVGENVQQLNDVWVANVALVVSFRWELSTVYLQERVRKGRTNQLISIQVKGTITRSFVGFLSKLSVLREVGSSANLLVTLDLGFLHKFDGDLGN